MTRLTTLALSAWGSLMDASFDYGCASTHEAAPTTVTRFTQALWRVTPKRPHVKLTRTGSFSYHGLVKTWELPRPLSFSDPSAPFQRGTLTLKGRFLTRTTASGTVRIQGAGCDTGSLHWTATLGGH